MCFARHLMVLYICVVLWKYFKQYQSYAADKKLDKVPSGAGTATF